MIVANIVDNVRKIGQIDSLRRCFRIRKLPKCEQKLRWDSSPFNHCYESNVNLVGHLPYQQISHGHCAYPMNICGRCALIIAERASFHAPRPLLLARLKLTWSLNGHLVFQHLSVGYEPHGGRGDRG